MFFSPFEISGIIKAEKVFTLYSKSQITCISKLFPPRKTKAMNAHQICFFSTAYILVPVKENKEFCFKYIAVKKKNLISRVLPRGFLNK